MRPMTHSQQYINDCIEKYAALKILVETGEHFGHAARSLIAMDALVSGKKADYDSLVAGQEKDERLTYATFIHLSDHFYFFKVKPELRELLEIYIVLDDYSRTSHAKEIARNLPEKERHPENHEQMLLSMIRYEMIPEVEKLNLFQLDTLRGAFRYREAVIGEAEMPNTFEFADSEKLLVFAGVICNIAGIAGCLNLSGSLTLTEEVAKTLLFLMNNRNDPDMASRLCGLAV